MLHTFAGGCEEEALPAQLTSRPEIFGTPGPNEDSAELQVSVHSPGPLSDAPYRYGGETQ